MPSSRPESWRWRSDAGRLATRLRHEANFRWKSDSLWGIIIPWSAVQIRPPLPGSPYPVRTLTPGAGNPRSSGWSKKARPAGYRCSDVCARICAARRAAARRFPTKKTIGEYDAKLRLDLLRHHRNTFRHRAPGMAGTGRARPLCARVALGGAPGTPGSKQQLRAARGRLASRRFTCRARRTPPVEAGLRPAANVKAEALPQRRRLLGAA